MTQKRYIIVDKDEGIVIGNGVLPTYSTDWILPMTWKEVQAQKKKWGKSMKYFKVVEIK